MSNELFIILICIAGVVVIPFSFLPCSLGIPFSGTSKPAFFPELKLRLDRFLSSRAEDTASSLQPGTASARTLGTADQIAAHLCRVGHTGGQSKAAYLISCTVRTVPWLRRPHGVPIMHLEK